MEMEIEVKEWKVLITEQKQKTIGGTYQIKLSGQVISKSEFNKGYNSTDIAIPSDIMVEVEGLDAKIKKAIIENFTK